MRRIPLLLSACALLAACATSPSANLTAGPRPAPQTAASVPTTSDPPSPQLGSGTTQPDAPPTTEPPAPPEPAYTPAAVSSPVVATSPPTSGPASHTGTGACGGDLPPCAVMDRESHGDPTAVSPVGYCDTGDGRCRGKWQWDAATWNGYGGYTNADEAPESVQDDKARQVYAGGAGCNHWKAC